MSNSWAVLTTNSAGANALLRGSLHIDRSGSFDGDLIAVTGGDSGGDGGEVWRINSTGASLQLANITNTPFPHLEGVITLTNEVERWGPLAGRIITGAESATPPLIDTVATNGQVSALELGIEPEDFDIIQTNQDLYCLDQGRAAFNITARLVKLSGTLLTNYWGDLLVTQEGMQHTPALDPKLFILHWNYTNSNFEVRCIPYTRALEHVTFAPITLPDIPPQ